MKNKRTSWFIALGAVIVLALVGCGDKDSGDPTSPPGEDRDIAVTFNSVSANGSTTQTTTQLTLTFSKAITGLSAGDITFSGVSGVSKGTLSGSGPTYTLPISGFSSGGSLSVSVKKSGYAMSGSPKTVTIYRSDNPATDIPVTLNSVVPNGSVTQTTTQLALIFDQAITGLSVIFLPLPYLNLLYWMIQLFHILYYLSSCFVYIILATIETCRKFPTPEVLDRLAEALCIETHELFTLGPSPQNELEKLRQDIIGEVVIAIKQSFAEESKNKR